MSDFVKEDGAPRTEEPKREVIFLKKKEVISLKKKEVVSLVKEGGEKVKKATLGLGWRALNRSSVDLDTYVVLMSNGNVVDFIYFSNRTAPGVKHNGDDLHGGGRADDPNETIDMNFDKLNPNVDKIIAGFTIYSGARTLADVTDAFASIDVDGKRAVKFDLDGYSNHGNVICGTFNKKADGTWEFVGDVTADSRHFSDVRSSFRPTHRVSAPRSTSTGSPAQREVVQERRGFFGRLVDGICEIFD